MMRLTQRGVWVLVLATVLLGLGGWWRYPGLLAIGSALVLVTTLDAAVVALGGGLSPRRRIEPLEVPRYGSCTGQLTVVHGGRWFAVVADGAEPVADAVVPVPVGWLRPGQQIEVEYAVPTQRRGRLRVGPLRLRRYGSAGLTAATELAGTTVDVRVLPRVLPVQAIPPGAVRGHVGADERVAHGGTDIVGLREYVDGDDLRRVHWATSARTGTLMVREDADPARPHLAVLLDDRAASYAGGDTQAYAGDGTEAFEYAVEVAASLAWAGALAGSPVRVRGCAGSLDVALDTAVAGGAPGPELLSALADVSLVDEDGGVATVAPAGDPDVLVVVTGPAADTSALALTAGRAQTGVVLAVSATASVTAAGPVALLRGPKAEDLLSAWDRVVGGSA
jgi:uncharacterized protein (DUF58 family)